MRSRQRFVAPDAHAIVDICGDHVRILGMNGVTLDARGALGRELLTLIDEGRKGPLLEALGDRNELDELRGVGRVPLNALRALALSGFGLLFIELLGRCNERCVHCYADSAPEVESALTLDVVRTILDQGKALGFECVQLTGGDPLLCAFLPEAVAHATALEMKTEIYTNGIALSDRLLSRIAPFRPRFAFSFYSHRPETHDAITRTPHSHALTSRAIERALAANLEVRAAVVVMEENERDIRETVSHLRALGVEHVALAPGRAVGRGSAYRGEIDPKLYELVGGAHGDTRAERGRLAVASDGSVYPCIFNRAAKLGNVHDRPLPEIVAAPQLRRSLTGSEDEDRDRLQCIGCRLTSSALRACAEGAGPQ